MSFRQLLALIPCLFALETSVAQTIEREPRPVIGVIGQVSKPGTYELRGQPTLHQALERAGGLTVRATGQIVVVRNGVAKQKLRLDRQRDVALFPSDLLIVESAPDVHRNNAVLRSVSSPHRFVQLGFVGLAKHPIVVKMPRPLASIGSILDRLRQPEEVAETTHVILPPTSSEGADPKHEMTMDDPLPTDTVVVFNEDDIDSRSLPELPPIDVLDAEEDLEATLPSDLSEETSSPEAIGYSEFADGPLNIPASDETTAEGIEVVTEASGYNTSPPPPGIHAGADDHRVVMAVPPSDTLIGTHGGAAAPIEFADEAANEGPNDASMNWIVGIIVLLATGVAAMLLTSMARSVQTKAVSPVSEPREEDVLDLVIRGELPLTEESCLLPSGLSFQITPAHRRPRVDAASGAPRPHIPPHPQESTPQERPSELPISEEELGRVLPVTASDSDTPRTQAHKGNHYSLLERVLLSVHGGPQQ